MFWKKKAETSELKVSKLPGPKGIPDIVGGHLVTDFDQEPDWVWKLRSVQRRRQEDKNVVDIRVFDDVEVATSKVRVQDYTSLDEHPELIWYEGWFNKEARQVQLEQKKTA